MESELTSAPDLPETEAGPSPPQLGGRRYLIRYLIQLSIFLTLYVLSIGPLFWQWFASYHSMSSPFFAAFYMPLLMACDFCPPLAGAVNWYINLWI